MSKSVLLVDDDPDDHEIFIQELAVYDKSIKVVSAFSGADAFKILEKNVFDLIFLDHNLPGMKGLEMLEKLKDDENFKAIPVYFYSTSDGFINRALALKLGAVQYFQKPSDIKTLKEIFKAVFETDVNN